jgi:PAT family beta-lactamase induction signal transducer AmpG
VTFAPAESPEAPEAHNTPALFAVLVLPYAFSVSVTFLLTPYLLRKHGMSVDQIARVVVVAGLPSIWSFLWSPLADAGLRKRSWVVVSSLGAGLAGAIAILSIDGSQAVLTGLLFMMNAFGGLLSSACGALLTAMSATLRGRSAGWYQSGNTGGAAAGGGLFIWLADHASVPILAGVILAAMLAPALAAWRIKEPPPVRRAIGPQISGMLDDMGSIFRSRRTWIGLVFLLSPVGSAAVGNLISGMGPDYHASGSAVLWVTGIGGGLLSALGCFLGGVVADKIGSMFAYALAGGLAAIFALYLGLAPATPFTYAAGYSGYAISAGFAYAVFTAMVLDILGRRKHAAASGYAVLNSAGNLPIAYMTWLDGLGYQHWGARGLMATDAAANGSFVIILLLVAIFLGRYRNPDDDATAGLKARAG